ncbi:carbohydrate ABC transporter permease [Cohnella nanjingensis]|uniref:Sugar ABC transporter permease n=1 Tax=Cohnella nanjingensis TaxID=1387779 RepID=A0A7X0RNQ3_9BACL|nr:sugar ABC transporter permease [Cohnella nanjingensis]MBB6670648.1 sugar ABC transporter permease [Cohnella nanjingensis]
MLVPGLLLFLVLFITPSMGAFYYAFTDLTDFNFFSAKYVGWENFKTLFDTDGSMLALKNTIIFTVVTTVFKITIGLGLAVLLNMKLRTTLYLRTVFFFPVILSTVAVALAFSAIYHPTTGLLNQFLRLLGLDFLAQNWITDRGLVMYSISAVEVWKWTGIGMVLFLAGLQSIPQDAYESATIDGANAWQQFRSITLPLLLPSIKSVFFLSMIGGLKVFDIVIALTNGGPGKASTTLNYMVYEDFSKHFYGEGTAASLLLFLLILVTVAILNLFISRKEVEL